MVLISDLEYLASRMRFILFVSALKGACAVIAQTHILLWNLCRAKGGGIVPVNCHVNPMDVNAKVSDDITNNNHIITVDVEVD